MSNPNPQVSVFHFTSNISQNKINKYKKATERGMSAANMKRSREEAMLDPVPPRDQPPTNPPERPPIKRLKLNVRAPTESSSNETSTVATRPKRASSLRIRYDSNMTFPPGEDLRASPGGSSDLTSLTSTPSLVVRDSVVEDEIDQDYGRHFASYYVLDDDDDGNDKPKAPSKPKTVKPPVGHPPKTQRDAFQRAPPPMQPPQSKLQTEFRHHVPPPSRPAYPPPAMRPAPPQLVRMPKIELVDLQQGMPGQIGPQSVKQMKAKLEALSHALTQFGGVPGVPQSPVAAPVNTKRDDDFGTNPLDGLLGIFEGDGDDSDDGDDDSDHVHEAPVPKDPLGYLLEDPGHMDGPLIYGIQFIQNALRSWAEQRLGHIYAQQMTQQQPPPPPNPRQKRGPGRPRKFQDGEQEVHPSAPPPLDVTIRVSQDSTPEGVAIRAFEEVLASGCLRVNAHLPIELTRALRHLYMQIDHLINQGAKTEQYWHPMSYGAQIAGNQALVKKLKDIQAKAQQEMARQQQMAQQQTMQHMGSTSPQLQRDRGRNDRKRGMQQAAAQPYNNQHHPLPFTFESQPGGAPNGFMPSSSTANFTNGHLLSGHSQSSTPTGHNGLSNGLPSNSNFFGPHSQRSGSQRNPSEKGKIRMSNEGLLTRSGQTMQYSFQASGPQQPAKAVPAPVNGSTHPASSMILPSAALTTLQNGVTQVNGHAHGGNGVVVNGAGPLVSHNNTSPVVSSSSSATIACVDAASPAAHPANSTSSASPTAASRSSVPVNAVSPVVASTAMDSNPSLLKNVHRRHASDAVSKYPHPGAVVIDE